MRPARTLRQSRGVERLPERTDAVCPAAAHRLRHKLPDGTGFDFVKWLRGQRRGGKTPCLAITGSEQHFRPIPRRTSTLEMRKPIDVDRFCTGRSTFCTVAVALAQQS
jgi:hypothetical protein